MAFDADIVLTSFKQQKGRCTSCGKDLVLGDYAYGLQTPWLERPADGNPDNTSADNCACVCVSHLQYNLS